MFSELEACISISLGQNLFDGDGFVPGFSSPRRGAWLQVLNKGSLTLLVCIVGLTPILESLYSEIVNFTAEPFPTSVIHYSQSCGILEIHI